MCPSNNMFIMFLGPLHQLLFKSYLVSVMVGLLVGCHQSSQQMADILINISGKIRYEDRLYNQRGFYGTRFRPVRNALVDAVDEEGNVLRTTETDNNGNYTFIDIKDTVISISVRAESNDDNGQIYINNQGGRLYAVSETIDKTILPAVVNIDISADHPVGGAFNMLDVFSYAMEYAKSLADQDKVFNELNVYWSKSDGRYGTYMCNAYDQGSCRNGAGIYVLGGVNDTDEYDDDVLLHEFGHYLEYVYGLDSSPGGQHDFWDNQLDLRLSWSEGWGNYISIAIRTWMKESYPYALSASQAFTESISAYLDTNGSVSGVAVYFDFINLDTTLCGATDCFVYATNETAVTNVLYKISGETNGKQSLWDIVTLSMSNATTPHNLELFWDYLLPANRNISPALLLNYFTQRKINYYADSQEPDNDALNLSVIDCATVELCINNEFHTLYNNVGEFDMDWVAVNLQAGQQYSFETNNLTNGADTYLKLFEDLNGNPIAEDDDRENTSGNATALDCTGSGADLVCPHNGSNFSSQIIYTPANTGVVYLQVSVPDGIYDDASFNMVGRYGGYELTVKTLP